MKILSIPSTSDRGLDAEMDFRLGRCPYFTFVELDDESKNKIKAVTITPNPGSAAMGGAGSMSVQCIATHGTDVVIVAQVGPNAAAALAASGMKVVSLSDMSSPPYTIEQVIDAYIAGQIVPFNGANVASHAGMGGGGGRRGAGAPSGAGRHGFGQQ